MGVNAFESGSADTRAEGGNKSLAKTRRERVNAYDRVSSCEHEHEEGCLSESKDGSAMKHKTLDVKYTPIP